MRVLLIGQKIVTLEDLNSYFFDHHVHGYVSAGAPNLLSLDIVRHCGIHMIICQTSDYTMEHLLTFMNKVKEHNPSIMTLLISEEPELTKINESMLDIIDDFLVLPFTPSEFHTRLMKLIAKSLSPHSKVSPDERLRSILALMAEHPDSNEDKNYESEYNDDEDGEDSFYPNTEILTKNSSANEVNHKQEESVKVKETVQETVQETVKETEKWPISRFAELIKDVDFVRDPLLKTKTDPEIGNEFDLSNDVGSSVSFNSNAETHSIESENTVDSATSQGLELQKKENAFSRLMEFVGRIIYILLVIFLIIFTVIVIKSYYDGGVASVYNYGVYSNTGNIEFESTNLVKGSYPGALVFSSGVRPTTPYGNKVLLILPWLGYLVEFAKTPLGFVLVIIAPLVLVFFVEIFYWIQRRKAKYD